MTVHPDRLRPIHGATDDNVLDRLLLCAEQAFLTKGYRATKLSEISLAAGISKKTIYKYVESKEALFCRVVEEAIAASLQPASLMERGDDIAAVLSGFIRPYMHLAFSDRGIRAFKMLLSEAFQFPDLAHQYFASVRAAVMTPLEVWLGQQAQEGLIVISSPESAAEMLLAMTVTERAQRLALGLEGPPTPDAIEKQLETAITIFLNGVKTAPFGRRSPG